MQTVLIRVAAVVFCLSAIGCGVEVNVGDEGVKVKAPGVDIDVSDENGVNVQAPGVDVHVKDDDVKVDTPGAAVRVKDDNVSVTTSGGNADDKQPAESPDESPSEDNDQ